MSSEQRPNLSYSVNLRESTVLPVDITSAVNKTLQKFYLETHYEDYLGFYKQHKCLLGAEKSGITKMQSEKIILCEINAGLWVKAIKSAISATTCQTYPHYLVVQEFINYLLNADTNENFGLLENFFWRLLLFHPPTLQMFNYYSQIMLKHFIILDNERTEEHNFLVCLMEVFLNTLQTVISNGIDEWNPDFVKYNDNSSTEYTEQERVKVMNNLKVTENSHPEKKLKPQAICFGHLQWKTRIKRYFIALNFAYNILETNFAFWLDSVNWKPYQMTRETSGEPRLLLSQILWPDARDIGLINKNVHKILDLYKLLIKSNLSYQCKNIIEKYTVLIGEVIRCSDSADGLKYPFVGISSGDFFRELSVILHEALIKMRQTTYLSKEEVLVNFKPSWLRLFLCSHLLSSITGSQCRPELTTACDILMQCIYNESRNKDIIKVQENTRKMNSKEIQKLKKLKSINAKNATGKTHLHIACEENNIEKVKALLALPELDVNVTDKEGWTPLHRAAHMGNVTIVKELLSFSPKWGNLQKAVNTRARGPQSITPIMSAALNGHVDVCEILLEHSGTILLEDSNEFNETALELGSTPEVTKKLEHKKKDVAIFHSHKDLGIDLDMKFIVLRLCTEMVQAYFSTHRTWDVYRSLKRYKKEPPEEFLDTDLEDKWDYMRYHRDIKRNIYKLRILILKLDKTEEFKSLREIFMQLLALNKAG